MGFAAGLQSRHGPRTPPSTVSISGVTLTVCCLGGEEPAQVAAILACFRPVADEIFVAVDSRVDPSMLGPYDDVADRVVRYEFGLHPDRARPWLYAQCRADWIFSIDGDEVPSPALVDALPELISTRDIEQYVFPRRWLFPHPGAWLEELPWWPDFQIRLGRNRLGHSGRLHDSVDRVLPAQHLDVPIYHLALLAADREERRTRSERYDAYTPGLAAYGGGGLNAIMYLPEDAATTASTDVPMTDRPWIDAVLGAAARSVPARRSAATLDIVGREAIDLHVRQVEMGDDDHRATITAFGETNRMTPGEVRPVYVRVRNDGSTPWPWGFDRQPLITLGYRWRDVGDTPTTDDGRRSPLTATVHPGTSIIVPVFVAAPARAGNYPLAIDLVHEHVRWFETPLILDMVVAHSPSRPATDARVPMLVTTIVAHNYLPRARLLARSFLRLHPTGRVVVLVIDAGPDETGDGDEPFEVLTFADLPIEPAERHRMAAIYDVTELATAVKPFLLRLLLFDRGEPAVTFLDPDIEVFAPLDDLDLLAREQGIVLTPHRLLPVPADHRQPDARSLMQSGVFNLGFISLGPGSRAFLEEWSDHCRRNCIIAHDQALFVDQRWVDAGVARHRHHIVTDPGCNVAYWNLDERPITRNGVGYLAAGQSLRFFHYSGFDSRSPHLLSQHQGDRPRILLSELPVLRELVAGYADRLDDATAGAAVADARPYGWSRTPGGFPLDALTRRIVRDEILRRENGESNLGGSVDDLPDVFGDLGDDGLLEILTSPLPGSPVPRVGRYLHHIYLERPDVQGAFPNLRGTDLEGFHSWVRTSGRVEHDIPAQLVPRPVHSSTGPIGRVPLRCGVNIIGYFAAELGIGEAGRAMLATLEHLGEPCAVVNETTTANRQEYRLARGFDEVREHDINLMVINSDQLPRTMESLRDRLRPDQYTVGVWAWELEEFPASMHIGVPYVDEVWTYSRHAFDAIGRAIDTPVHCVPLPVVEYSANPDTRNPLAIDAAFTFLFCFDFHSFIERKNPFGVVDAFCRAFAPGEGPTLIIKSINGRSALRSLEMLRGAANGRPDIHIVDAYLDIADTRALIASCDCYVSLHRAEGFGYTMAEAMLGGKPVIASNYSGNLEFMNDSNSFLVSCGRSEVPPGCDPYPAGAVWGDPDLAEAARLMRLVYEDESTRARVGAQARQDIGRLHSPAARAPLIAARLAAIRARPRPAAPSHANGLGQSVARVAWRATRRAGRLRA